MQGDSLMVAEQSSESGREDFRKKDGASVEPESTEDRFQKPNVAPQNAELTTKSGMDKVLNGIEDHKEVAPIGMLSLQEDLHPRNVAPQSGSIAETEGVAAKSDDEKSLQEMRAKIAELDPLSKDIDDATLRRFLRARSMKVPKAVKMFLDHQKWRRVFAPLGHILQDEIKNELEAEKVYLQGQDKHGRSIAVIMANKHDAYKRNFEEFKRYFVFSFDTTIASLKPGGEKFTVILDLQGLGYKNLDTRGWISTFDFLQGYYPERLGRLFIVRVPKLFWGAWKLVYPFIDKVTREKIIFVENKHLEAKLLEEIEKDQLPTLYGGTLPLVPIQNVVIPNWPPKDTAATQDLSYQY